MRSWIVPKNFCGIYNREQFSIRAPYFIEAIFSDVRLFAGHVVSGLHACLDDFSQGTILSRTRQLRPGDIVIQDHTFPYFICLNVCFRSDRQTFVVYLRSEMSKVH